jgi:hypothetical protein
MSTQVKINKAVKTYLDRQVRKEHPGGEFDSKGRWYPDEEERQECCDSIRRPSRCWPYSLLSHCRSAEHVANGYEIPVKELRRAIRQAKEAK